MLNQQAKSELKDKEMPIAYELAKKQKEISVAEFFTKNRHLLGFDNKRKALLMAVKEAVDNSLDACEEARVLPEISVEIIEMSEFKYKVIVEDNGPGIVKKQIPNIFAKLLYGSKFHTLKQARGQQGIGISAAVLYAQLTTGRAAKITSRVSKKEPAFYYELNIDTQNNKPVIAKEETVEWAKEHGTKVEIDLEAEYIKGNQSVDEYLKQTAVINPHVTIIYTNPKSEQVIYARATDKLPDEPKEIKPHPYGVELGMLMDKLRWTESRTLQSFLTSEFSRVGPGTAKEICEH
ncbi:MAG: DNA topoisomerase VI subunit B, partial [Nanoarchaeota archaeon]